MTWLEWLIGRLTKKPPGRISNLRITVTMRIVNCLWDLPTTREDGKALPVAEIADTEVLVAPVSASGIVGAFTSLAKVRPDATQTVTHNMPDGTYRLRFIVTDIYGQRGKPVEASAIVKSALPGVVTNIRVTIE